MRRVEEPETARNTDRNRASPLWRPPLQGKTQEARTGLRPHWTQTLLHMALITSRSLKGHLCPKKERNTETRLSHPASGLLAVKPRHSLSASCHVGFAHCKSRKQMNRKKGLRENSRGCCDEAGGYERICASKNLHNIKSESR